MDDTMSEPLGVSSADIGKPNVEELSTSGVVKPKTEGKDLINAILGEMKSEFNRDVLKSAGKLHEPALEAKKKETRQSVNSEKKIKDVPTDVPKKVRSRSLEVLKNGSKVVTKDPHVKEVAPLSKEVSLPTKDNPIEESKEVPTSVPKCVMVVPCKDNPVDGLKTESKEGSISTVKNELDTNHESKPRIVITLKATEDTSDGHKKQKLKGGNNQLGNDEVWTVKVEPSVSPQVQSTGKRSLRSQTAVKSSTPEPEGVKRSARRRSKDLPRESVLQSAIARKEKSFSLGQSDEKQCRTPRHRSPVSSPEKTPKSSDSKRSVPKPIKAEYTSPKVVKLESLTPKPSRLENLIPKVHKPEVLVPIQKSVKLEVSASVNVLSLESNSATRPNANTDLEEAKVHSAFPANKIIVRGRSRLQVDGKPSITDLPPSDTVGVKPTVNLDPKPSGSIDGLPKVNHDDKIQGDIDTKLKAPIDRKPESNLDGKPSATVDARLSVNPDVRSKVNPDVRSKVNPDAISSINPPTKLTVNPGIRLKINSDVRLKVNPLARSTLDPDTRSKVNPDGRSKANPDPRSMVNPDARLKLSLESRSRLGRPLLRPSTAGSRVMLAMKSAPTSMPTSLVYTKTGKRRYRPYRGLKYSLTSGGGTATRRTKIGPRTRGSPNPEHMQGGAANSEVVAVGDQVVGIGCSMRPTPVMDEACQVVPSTTQVKRKASCDAEYIGGGEASKRRRQDIAPSPSPADISTAPSKPESTAISSGAGTAGVCFCQTRSQLFVSTVVGASDIYCQAVDSLDDRLVGCCNSITDPEVRMMRPSKKVAYMILCEVHTERLLRHNCCPGCGVFCTQGKFVQCSSNHFYHRSCQLVGNFCPHCGVDSPESDSKLFFKSHSSPVIVPQQKSYKKFPTAKMGFNGCVVARQERDPPSDGSEALLRLPCGREVSTHGLPPSLDKEKLESLLAIAGSMPSNVAIRHSVKSLYHASKSGNAERLINVLASGLNPNHPFREGLTCLHLAAVSSSIGCVHLLVQAGSELDAMDKDQNTALMLATLTGNNAVVKYLVKAGACVTLKGSDGQTALHLAAKSGNLEACHYLLSVANVGRSYINSEDDGGWTPLVWAAEHCHVLVAKFLLERRADPFVRDSEQNIALHWSAFSGCMDISELLLNYGSEVNCVNVHGDTPLHIGARQNMYHCVLMLLMRGAKVSVKNKAGDTPLECCAVKPSDCHTVISLNMQLQSITNHPARRLLCNDISRGKETNPVQCVNNEDAEGEPSDFVYVSENCYTSHIAVDRTITSMQSCRCTRDGCTGAGCKCGSVSLQCWYDPQGKLLPEFNFADPPMIFECNQGCACNRVTCHNRVVQHGITCRFQLFRTREKGWGVRTLRHIEKGAYVCEYIGEIISDGEADHREDDSYLFDLDNRDGETYCIDARHYGNVARFVNHMCMPNLMPVRVFIDHQDLHFPRIAFFANRDILADEELGFDYGEKFWIIKCKSFTCTCGAAACRYSDHTIHQTLENYQRRQQLEDNLLL